MDMEIVTFLGLKRLDQNKVYNNRMVQYSFLKLQYNTIFFCCGAATQGGSWPPNS